ncbi:MAG: prepilin-type N-terminal cleavage/methylation domain-containing protein [Sumerlaeia bacterium]
MKTGNLLRNALRRRERGFSFLEVMIAMVIVSIVGIGIYTSVIVGLRVQQATREFNGAIKAANDALEGSKGTLFQFLEPRLNVPVTIDDRGTPQIGDDLEGVLDLRFYSPDRSTQYFSSTAMPTDGSMIRAEATVTWIPSRTGTTIPDRYTLTTMLAP